MVAVNDQTTEQATAVTVPPSTMSDRVKRALDVVAATAGLLVLWPVMAVCAGLILVTDGAPVLFSQRRSGLGGREFELRKFRTMTTESDDPTTDAARITRLGAFLRKTSLDELPTLLNVIRGDISIVGPRPLPVRYLERYDQRQRRRLEVRPGITGLAQARGRNQLSWDERFELDVEYVETRSLLGDLSLIWQTLVKVLKREGIEAEGGPTMPEFFGPQTALEGNVSE